MYQWKSPRNLVNHFLFDKALIKGKRWANMPFAAKSIFPVIAVHRGENGAAFPAQTTIAIMAGVDPKTVRKGLDALDDTPGFSRTSKINARGHRFYTYKIRNGSPEKGRSFAFFRAVIDGGNWHLCSDSARAVYPVMMAFSYFDLDEYTAVTEIEEHQDLTISEMNQFITDGDFAQRRFDFCSADLDVLAEYAGITERSVRSALESLEKHFLVERIASVYEDDDEDSEDLTVWKVYRIPPRYYKPEYMNKVTAERYGKNFPMAEKFPH